MPRRRRTPKARIGGVTPAQKRWFLNPFAALDDGPFETEAERRAIWEEHREEWLMEYEVTHPGRKPPAWWRYDAPTGSVAGH